MVRNQRRREKERKLERKQKRTSKAEEEIHHGKKYQHQRGSDPKSNTMHAKTQVTSQVKV